MTPSTARVCCAAPEHTARDAYLSVPITPPPRGGARFRAQDRAGRMAGEVDKEGVDTGRFAINPFTGERVPIWVANFVLADYGTGAIMAVPFGDQRDFEFAKKYSLPIRAIVAPKDGEAVDPAAVDPATMTEAWSGYGRAINSGEFSGLPSEEAWEKMADVAEGRHRHAVDAVSGCRTGASRGPLLGHADPGRPLPVSTASSRSGRSSGGRAPKVEESRPGDSPRPRSPSG